MTFSTVDDLEQRLRTRLDPLGAPPTRPPSGEVAINVSLAEIEGATRVLTPAAVLAPIVRRPEGWTVLLTMRTASMPTHAGQTAFPGGRVQPEDDGPVATALRETFEEIGVSGAFISPIGQLEIYETGSGYAVTPVVAFVEPGFTLAPDEREVDAVFEMPVSFLFDPRNHAERTGEFRGMKRTFYEMVLGEHRVWGATAGMVRVLYERLYG